MKKKLQHITICIVLAGLLACRSNGTKESNHEIALADTASPTSILLLDRLVGKWQGEDGKSFESWTKETPGMYHSISYTVNGKDTVVNERADIYKENEAWVFETRVKGQNDEKSVKFVSVFLNGHSIQFSNPEHDFPNELNYTLIDNEHVHAFIIGKSKRGATDTIPFNYKRVH